MRSCIFGLIGVIGLVAGGLSQSSAQIMTPGEKCNVLHDKSGKPNDLDSFDTTALDKLKPNPTDPNDPFKKLFTSGLPCRENLGFGKDKDNQPVIEILQRGFDFYSWLTFIALNRPLENRDGFASAEPNAKAWWESGKNFKPLLDVMLPGGRKPVWDDPPMVPPACQAAFKANDKLMLVKMIEESFNQPFKTGPLIDQNNNYAIFDILMNRSMFDYIEKHKLYNRAEQEKNTGLRIDFNVGRQKGDGNSDAEDHGAIMLKVSWKILDSEDDKRKFHHVQALVAMPKSPDEKGEPPCIEKTLGLVGFHVVHKTIGRPQWIWTSFEHIDNVPEPKNIAEFRDKKKLDANLKGHRYNFYTLSCEDDCPVNETPPRPWDPEYKNELKFRTNSKGQAIFNSQIVRDPPLTEPTNAINTQFHALLGESVWKHYILIGTQWPSDQKCTQDLSDPVLKLPDPRTDFEKEPDMNCAPAPSFLANSTLETYSQGTIPQASSSCMGCHGNAVSYQRRPAKPADAGKESPKQADAKELTKQVSAKEPTKQVNAKEPPKPTASKEPPKMFNQSDFTFMLEKAR